MSLYTMMGDAYWYGGASGGGGASPPPLPTGLTPSSGTQSAAPVLLGWSASPGAKYYVVNVLHNSAGNWLNDVVDATAVDAPFGFTPPANGVTYAWKARACNDAGCSADSAWVFFDFNAGPPATPTGLSPASGTVSDAVVDFAWAGSPGATSYVLNIGHWEGSNTVTDLVDYSLPQTDARVQLAAHGASYFWKVRACNAAGCSLDSAWGGFFYP
jgi:hypothetical protein